MNDTTDYTPEWPPNWKNASDDGLRSYSSHDSVLIQADGVTRCAVGTFAAKFTGIFGPTFTLFFLVVCWFAIDEFRERVAFMLLGLFCGTATFGLIYAIMKHHQDQGDYIVVDSVCERVELPRKKRVFNTTDVRCLQLLTGCDRNDEVVNNSDLNLLVDEGGEIIRYHLMANPNKEHAKLIAQAMRTSLIEQIVPPGWYRSSDSG